MSGPPRLVLPDLPPSASDTLLERAGALVYALDADQRLLTVNRALRTRIDQDVSATTDLAAFFRLLYPDLQFRDAALLLHQRILAGAPRKEVEWVLTTRDGEQRQVRWQFHLFMVPEKLLVVVGEDVSDRRKLEQWVRLQNALLAQIGDAIVVADTEGRIIHWTGAAEKLLGYTPRSALERPLTNLIPEEPRRSVVMGWVSELSARGEMEWQQLLRREAGDTLTCRIRGARVQNERAQMVGVALLISPVLPETAAPSVDPEETSLAKVLAQTGLVATVVCSPDGVVRVWGRGAERLGGIGAGRALGKRLFDEVMFSSGLSWETVATRLGAQRRHQARIVIERLNGTRVPADMDVLPIRNADGKVREVLAVFVDRSEMQDLMDEALAYKGRSLQSVFAEGVARRVQDATGYFEPDHRVVLAQLQDLRTLGRLVRSGAAHREVDAFVRSGRVGESDGDLDDLMYRLGEGVHRLRALVDDIGRFDGGEPEPPGPVRLSRELDAARELVGHLYENRITLDLLLEDLPPGRAARGPLLRALVLLLLAAAESCEAEDRPRVSVEGRHESGWIHLEFRDNGSGYPADVQSKLTDLPYLATQRGTAPLWLGMAREAVRLSGGTLELGTAAGTGTRVRLTFPAAESGVALPPMEAGRRRQVRGRVLLVEDDDLLRRGLERHIGEVHEVRGFATVAEALAGMEGVSFDSAIVAFPRPEGFGMRLLQRFTEAAPGMLRNTILLIPPGLKHGTRDKLVHQGFLVLTRPVDLTTLRSLLLRMMPPEELEVGEEVE